MLRKTAAMVLPMRRYTSIEIILALYVGGVVNFKTPINTDKNLYLGIRNEKADFLS